MTHISNLASLNLVKPEIDATLAQVEALIGSYVEERENPAPLGNCVEGLDLVVGAVRVADLPGAIELSVGLAQLMKQVQVNGAEAADDNFAALGQGLMVLGRYLEYVQLKRVGWPQLLIPAINQVRLALGQAPLAEGSLITVQQLPQAPAVQKLELSPDQLVALVRRLRLMYQTGLIAVLRDQADVPHYRMMRRACSRAQQICGERPLALQWWVASAMLEAFQQGVVVNHSRKALLSQFDRQLKALASNDGNARPDQRLLADSLYIVALSDEQTSDIQLVRAAFNLQELALTQTQMATEYELMCGPGGSVIRTVADAMKDELAHIKDSLDLMSRGAKNDEGSYQSMADGLLRTSQTLVMLGLLDNSQALRREADEVRKWPTEPDQADLHALVDILLDVENAVATLVKRVTPGADMTVNNARVSVHQLDEARALLVAESRSGLSLAKRAVSSYLDSDRDVMHLSNVPSTLQTVAGGLSFLGIERGSAVLRACARYIETRMINSEQQPNMADMETFADAVSGVDYYLESLEANKPIGESILEISEESMVELGFPPEGAGTAQ
jgi:hypothetical protein